MSVADLWIMTADQGTATGVQSALMSRASGRAPVVCGSMTELRSRLSQSTLNSHLSVALVDIDPDPAGTLHDLGRMIAAHPSMRFMVLSTTCNEGLILQAMQAGARHFLRKESIALELDNILERLLSGEPRTTGRLGDVISVFSCSGGCGATTVAVNLANELRLASAEPVLVVDLDHHYGSVASYLGVSGDYGIAHVLSRGSDIDRHLIETGAVGFQEDFDVLLSPAAAAADAALPMSWENLPRAVEACRESYRYVIIDAPRVPEPVASDLASLSHTAILVLQLTVRDISFAKAMIARLTGRGVSHERIWPLANRVKRRGPLLRLRESRGAIGMASLVSIREDWKRAVKSVNRGQPLAQTARRSRLRRDFCRLADRIHARASGAR